MTPSAKKTGRKRDKKKFYWDTCVLLAWIKGEQRDANQMAGLAQVAAEIEGGQAILITSVISRGEIFEADLTEEQKQRYARLFQRDNHIEYSADSRVLDKASKLRHASRTKPNGPVLTLPDATHLATAILLGADEFHTFDGTGKKARGVPLIPLSGTQLVEGLTICIPSVPPDPQGSLLDLVPTAPSST